MPFATTYAGPGTIRAVSVQPYHSSQLGQGCVKFGNDSNESIWLLGHAGRRRGTLASQCSGLRPLNLAVPREV